MPQGHAPTGSLNSVRSSRRAPTRVHRTTSDGSFTDELNIPVGPAAAVRLPPAPRLPIAASGLSADIVDSIAPSEADLDVEGSGPTASDKDRIRHSESTPSQLQASVPDRRSKSCYLKVSEALLYLTYIGVIAFSSVMLAYLAIDGGELHVFSWAVAGIFVCLALPITLHDVHMHCIHYVSPLQKYVVRIILIVPIYAIESWFALRYKDQKIYLETLRESYEAFVIYNFYLLLLAFLGGHRKLAERLEARPQLRAKCLPPCCCLRGWKMGSRFVHRCTVGVYQYVFLRVIVSVLALITQGAGVYNEGDWSPAYFYVYASVIINTSQMTALFCLAYFYMELREELKPLKPLYKFLVIKAIVFFSWWQGLGISILTTFNVIQSSSPDYTIDDVSSGLQDFVICIEMLIAAIAHHYCYSYKDFYSPVTGQATPLAMMQRAEHEFDAHRRVVGVGAGSLGSTPHSAQVLIQPPASAYSMSAGNAPTSTYSAATPDRGGSLRAVDDAATATPSASLVIHRGGPGSLSSTSSSSRRLIGGAGASPGIGEQQASVAEDGGLTAARSAAVFVHANRRAASASFSHDSGGSLPSSSGGPSSTPANGGHGGSGFSMQSIPEDAVVVNASSAVSVSVSANGGADVGSASPNITPAPIGTVFYEMMPLDVIADTAEQLRTGFGMVHKWEKRRVAAAEDAAKMEEMAQRGHNRSKPRSKFNVLEGASPGQSRESRLDGDGAVTAPSPSGSIDDAGSVGPAGRGSDAVGTDLDAEEKEYPAVAAAAANPFDEVDTGARGDDRTWPRDLDATQVEVPQDAAARGGGGDVTHTPQAQRGRRQQQRQQQQQRP